MRKLILTIITFSTLFCGYTQDDLDFLLIARNTGKKILASNDTILTMGFALSLNDNPNVPGPTLEFNEGDSVHIDLWNVSQGAPHTIHLHGLDVDQQNDGVPHLSFSVSHMDHGYYNFKAPHAGTYLYHCHVVSSIHVQAGMYGIIIIHPSDGSKKTWNNGYNYEHSLPLMFSEIDTVWHNPDIMRHDHDTSLTIHSIELPIYKPQFYLVNGLSDHQIIDSNLALNTSVNAVNYLRLINIGFKGVRIILPSSFNAQIVASDGRPLPSSEWSDTLEIYPGERYGVLGHLLNEGTSLIKVEYFDLNTNLIENTQEVPIHVVGYLNTEKLNYDQQTLTITPNTISNNDINIEISGLTNYQNVQLNLLDFQGKIIDDIYIEDNIQAESYNITYSPLALASGIYFVQMTINGQTTALKKVVKY